MADDVITKPNIEIVRTLDAPRELVWRAWTTPSGFTAWFGAPGATCPSEECEMDVRPGGAWKALMHAGEHGDIHWHGAFQEVDEPEHLVFTISDRPEEVFDLCEVILRDLGDGRTEMTFRQGGDHMDEAGYEQAKAGWGGFFDALASQLA
jgi:uncharacterized protein YndB with AHSA1/START domain